MGAFRDLTGQQFGRLSVLRIVEKTKSGSYIWECRCECGKITQVSSGNLRSGHTLSCGCYMKDRISRTQATHRESHNRLYNVWSSMKQRCYDKNSTFFSHYGGRGITVCEQWRSSYESFRDWATTHGYDFAAPRGKCTLDRIDVNGNYSPENCRFVDMKIQRHNRRDSKGVF